MNNLALTMNNGPAGGDKVFESFDYRRHWDGTKKDTSAKAQEDVYVYMVQVFDQLGKAHILHGSVALIR